LIVTLYRDRHLEVLEKPAGIPVIPSRQGGGSLAGQTGLMVCHRLDTDTSGVLVMARSAAGHRVINQAFAEGRVGKVYAAVVVGELPDTGESDVPLGVWHRGRVQIGKGKAARTKWTVAWRRDGRCGVLAEPLTGRTHQIRAHLSHAGAPILGDEAYGGPKADRLYLHAHVVRLPWPGPHDVLEITSPIPPEFGWP
jgi:tRNA pseudouridine32 synthase/23S rRNA pseudouridine746 synthase